MGSTTHLFYQLDKLTSLKIDNQHLTLLRAGHIPLAEIDAHTTGQNSLLSVDEKGSLLASRDGIHSYSAHGHTPALCSALGFNGEHLERVSGAYLLGNGYRAFSPPLMRFLAPDSWSPFGAGGVNAHAYCSGDPVNRVDPSGHMNSPLRPGARTAHRAPTLPNHGNARRPLLPVRQRNTTGDQQLQRTPTNGNAQQTTFAHRNQTQPTDRPQEPVVAAQAPRSSNDAKTMKRKLPADATTLYDQLLEANNHLDAYQRNISYLTPGTEIHNEYQSIIATIRTRADSIREQLGVDSLRWSHF